MKKFQTLGFLITLVLLASSVLAQPEPIESPQTQEGKDTIWQETPTFAKPQRG